VEMYTSAALVQLVYPWTSHFENLFSNFHSHGEHLYQVSLKSLH